MKQTAVEFLESQYKFHGELYKTAIEQAKEMEKQQIIDAITQYQIKHNKIYSEQGILNVVDNAIQYYVETFKQQ
jgi:transcription termination factor Rho